MSSFEILIHPLAILQITQNATQRMMNKPESTERIVGILAGRKNEDTVTICQSAMIPEADLVTKKEQAVTFLREVYDDFVLLGWYVIQKDLPTQKDVDFHKDIMGDDQQGVLLMIDAAKVYDKTIEELPFNMYVLRNGLFEKHIHHMASVEIERIGVADILSAGSNEDRDKQEKEGIQNAIQTLQRKAKTIVTYLQAVKEGTVPADEAILSKIAQICSSLPVSDNSVFREELGQEIQDAQLIVLLMELAQATVVIGEQTHSYSELLKAYSDKMKREEEKRRMELRGHNEDFRMGGYPGMGFGMRPGMPMGYDDDDDSE